MLGCDIHVVGIVGVVIAVHVDVATVFGAAAVSTAATAASGIVVDGAHVAWRK